MTSQINFAAIDVTYPIAGQDNDSQGFRDNFSATQTALAAAKGELEALQSKALLKGNLTSNETVVNDMLGSSLKNGAFVDFHGKAYPAGEKTTTTTIDIRDGDMQMFSIRGNITLSFAQWPTTNLYAKVKIKLVNASSATVYTPILAASNGTIVYDREFPSLALAIDGTPKVIEAWTHDGGTTVYVRAAGEYLSAASPNRAVSGNLTVGGTLAVTNTALFSNSLTVVGTTDLKTTAISSLDVTVGATIKGLTVTDNTTLGNSIADRTSFIGIPKFPGISTAERDGLASPQPGMVIWNINSGKLQVCTTIVPNPTWVDLH